MVCRVMIHTYAHLATYIETCNTVKLAGVPEDAIHLNLFSFSMASEVKRWLHSFKGNSLWTWEEMVEKFLKKYFPKSKTAEGKVEISFNHVEENTNNNSSMLNKSVHK